MIPLLTVIRLGDRLGCDGLGDSPKETEKKRKKRYWYVFFSSMICEPTFLVAELQILEYFEVSYLAVHHSIVLRSSTLLLVEMGEEKTHDTISSWKRDNEEPSRVSYH